MELTNICLISRHYIEDTLELVWYFETKEVLDKYLAQTDKRKMIDANPNNKIYYDSLGGR